MELQENPATEPRPLRDLMAGLLNVSWSTLTVLLTASVGTALVAVPPVPLLALVLFSVVWAVTLIALFGALLRGMERRRRGPVAH